MLRPKELPNTPNVQIWPDGYVSPNSKLRKRNRKKKNKELFIGNSQSETISSDEEDDERKKYIIEKDKSLWRTDLLRRIEYYVFIITGSIIWYFLITKFLKWQRFPRHRHPIIVKLLTYVPIALLCASMYAVDSYTTSIVVQQDKKLKENSD